MPRTSTLVPVILLAAASAGLAGCGGEQNLVRDVAVASGVTGGEPKPAPDFVSRSRAPSVDYMPVGVSAPPREPIKDKKAVGVAEAELDALRQRNDQRGARARRAAEP